LDYIFEVEGMFFRPGTSCAHWVKGFLKLHIQSFYDKNCHKKKTIYQETFSSQEILLRYFRGVSIFAILDSNTRRKLFEKIAKIYLETLDKGMIT